LEFSSGDAQENLIQLQLCLRFINKWGNIPATAQRNSYALMSSHRAKVERHRLEKATRHMNEPEKGSLPRQWNNLSQKLIDMLNATPRNHVKVFSSHILNSLKAMFSTTRKRTATKLQSPRY
jgi:short subunit dehydrogenase-like uncharacterized protein